MTLEDLRLRAFKRSIDGYAEMTEAQLEAALAPVLTDVELEDASSDGTPEPHPAEVDEQYQAPIPEDLDAFTVPMLRDRAALEGIADADSMNKEALIAAIREAAAPDEAAVLSDDDDDAATVLDGDSPGENLEEMTVPELVERAHGIGIEHVSNLNKAELIEAILEAEDAAEDYGDVGNINR